MLPAVALAVLVAGAWIAANPTTGPMPVGSEWQARSAALEAAWRQQADPAWLREDARASALVDTLRALDLELGRLYAEDSADPRLLDPLWRERSQTLAALIDSRHQGGVAVQL
jgi:MoxR-like ATPase